MAINLTRRQAAGLLGLGAGAAVGLRGLRVRAQEPLKVGYIYVGPVGDYGWSYQHDQARQAMEAALGGAVQTTYVESVPEGADAERVLSQLARDGNRLIFATSFGYMNPVLRTAEQFPDVKFEHATGYKRADNVSTYAARFYEGRYVVGKVAGRLTKSNIIGYIGAVPIPEVIQGINSFTRSLQTVNPAAEVRVIWVNEWYNPGKESDAARALVDQGADILLQHTDSPAPVQVAEERGIWAVGQASDMSSFGPTSQITAIVDHWDAYYIARAKAVIDGSWASQDVWGGFAADMLRLSPWNSAIPAEVVAEAEETKKQITDGTVLPFAGPIVNQAGETVVAEGASMSDADILGMNFFVKGVVGDLPQ